MIISGTNKINKIFSSMRSVALVKIISTFKHIKKWHKRTQFQKLQCQLDTVSCLIDLDIIVQTSGRHKLLPLHHYGSLSTVSLYWSLKKIVSIMSIDRIRLQNIENTFLAKKRSSNIHEQKENQKGKHEPLKVSLKQLPSSNIFQTSRKQHRCIMGW